MVADPLGPTTRKQRKTLVAAAATSLVIVFTKVLPESLPSLGISKLDPKHVLLSLVIGNCYFIATSFIYGLGDYWTWEHRLRQMVHESKRSLTLEQAIELALKVHPAEFSQSRWLRRIARVSRPLRDLVRLRASKDELVQIFEEFNEGKRRAFALAWKASPIALTRILLDFWVAPVFGAAAILALVWRCLHT